MKRKENAVTEIVGTLIILGITLSLFTLVYLSLSIISPSPINPLVDIIGSIEDTNITVEHLGGKELDVKTEIIININGTDDRFTVDDYLNAKSKEDGIWSMGEKVVYPAGDVTGLDVSFTVVDPESESVVVMAKIQER